MSIESLLDLKRLLFGCLIIACSPPLFADYSAEILADQPIAYWRLGEAEGPTAVDATGNGNDATEEGAVGFGQSSLIPPDADTSVAVVGTNRLVAAPFEKFGEAGFSAECWVKLNAAPNGFGQIFGDGESGGDFNMMIYTGGDGFVRAHLFTDAGIVAADSPDSIADGRFHHVVSTWDSATGDLNLYIDSELVASLNHGGVPINTDNPIYIGKDNREPGRFDGTIDEVAFYDHPLSPVRIAAHYNEVVIPPPSEPLPDPGNIRNAPDGLAHFWDLNEASGEVENFTLNFAYDRVGTANGTFEGGAGRTSGLIGRGAGTFDNAGGTAINVGADGFDSTTGITIEALINTSWSGVAGDYDEIFRKEDGGNRILFSFQNDQFSVSANPPVAANIPVLSFGLNVGGYSELDMPLDGSNDLGLTLADIADGETHQVAATYDSVSGEKAIWVDGQKAWSVTLVAGTEVVSGGAAAATIGNVGPGGGETFTGTIDEVAFYNMALSSGEIAAHWENVMEGRNYFTEASDGYPGAVLADQPVAYYRLGDEGPVAVDGTGNGNDGEDLDGTVTFGAPSLSTPDDDPSISLGAGRILAPGFEKIGEEGFSVEFWTRIDAPPAGFTNLVGDGEGGLDFMLMVYMTTAGTVRPHVQTTTGFYCVDSLDSIADGQNHHIVSTWHKERGEVILYIDGEVADTTPTHGSFPTSGDPINTDNALYIGKDDRESGIEGLIDEVALYNYPLSAERVKAHFDLVEIPPPCPPLPDPGNLSDLAEGLVHFIDFDEADGSVRVREDCPPTINFAYDRIGDADGTFVGAATRTSGLIGLGAASFDNTAGLGVNLGAAGFETTTGITVEALIRSEWNGEDYDEIFRKEDGGNRILLSFQNDANNGGANPPVDPGPVLSFGLNIGGYGELDMPLDGTNDLGLTVEDITDGEIHHVVATYDSATGVKAIWIDGSLAWSVELAPDTEITSGGGAVATIGNVGAGEPFTGVIDEFAFYTRALTEDEIGLHYSNVERGGPYWGGGTSLPIPRILEFEFDPATLMGSVVWAARRGKSYAFEISFDLETWLEVEDGIEAEETTMEREYDLSPLLPPEVTETYVRVREVDD